MRLTTPSASASGSSGSSAFDFTKISNALTGVEESDPVKNRLKALVKVATKRRGHSRGILIHNNCGIRMLSMESNKRRLPKWDHSICYGIAHSNQQKESGFIGDSDLIRPLIEETGFSLYISK
ncbi:hypothetical protein O6P43_017408 [Quillaja saponaria]|uniref:Uncharacterized protein n=1 Tax=Quillaja saponaria TaxID=32244 RepID=A0AAD7LPV1_QUISA|nr:hypothetical protein O6P43_017408 [Quillaja saponaria]